ncbi:HPr-rel-A system PqqD family peptide chaperone [Massilia horti]|nr:HPr-rel-A system PqqD family peptide chaperone [Massilia horti]
MWRLIPGQSLAHRCWMDEFVVYNDLSGDTHLFGADAMQVLLCLREGPVDADALALRIGAGPHEQESLAVLLVELAALSLIEQA